ncbi:hypothetical protein DBR11_11760 [Pedobacter sp. HMWF019]|uniref:hypothetical protein n=1 Tax=Pedobacter sp. HMWF019 TaxID=2056856 RepID=UPI000D38F2B1|nr:hypothetical protein [Pedobacter sp. HMWF019]PTS99691.1 hypothetical protein DBR11_11760 [Pedobacter sp. HMWF019]
MKGTTFFLLLLFATKVYAAEPDMEEVKTLFESSAYSRSSADRLSKLLSKIDHSSPPLLICYKGVAEMMQAKYGFNPINKFRRFKRGKNLIEEAVKKEPDNLEIRFLRFVIQTNLPTFLNYNENIKEDKTYLLNNLQTTKDKKLKQDFLKYLSSSKLN